MLVQKINAWINSDQEFNTGLELLKEASGSAVIISMLERSGPTKFNQAKLLDQLLEIVREQIESHPEAEATGGFPTYDFFKLTDNLKKKHFEKSDLYKEAGEARAKMCHAKSDNERAEYAETVMRKMQRNQEIWIEIEYFLNHGHEIPNQKTVIPDISDMGKADLLKQRNNTRSNLSKWKKKLAIAQGEKKKELEEKITLHRQLLIEIEGKL